MAAEAAEDVMNEITSQRSRADAAEAELARLRELLASVRQYRVYVDEDGDGLQLYGPCADTIGCLFHRCFGACLGADDDEGVSLGAFIDTALEHERTKEPAHARVAEINGEGGASRG